MDEDEGDIGNIFRKILSNQRTQIKNQEKIYGKMSALSHKVDQISKRLNEIDNGSKSKAIVETLPNLPDVWHFPMINSEQELIGFEKNIEQNPDFRTECVKGLIDSVGLQPGRTNNDCALILDRRIFSNSFWTATAWTGGRAKKRKVASDNSDESGVQSALDGDSEENTEHVEDRNVKFAFSVHKTMINFIQQVIAGITKTSMSDTEVKIFVQSRSRNAFYEPKTDRLPTTRRKVPK